jgi:hypothetical protein
LGDDADGWREEGGVLELYAVPIVEEDWPLCMLSLDCESVEVVVRKLALERRRSSLKIDIVFFPSLFYFPFLRPIYEYHERKAKMPVKIDWRKLIALHRLLAVSPTKEMVSGQFRWFVSLRGRHE